jgi:DmsE family decaheme c-type cytochrome
VASGMKFRVSPFVLPCLLLLSLISTAALGQTQPSPAPTKQLPAAGLNATPNDGSGYVGADTCKTCHEEIVQSFQSSPHWKITTEHETHGGIAGCESCHGPGAEHAGSADPSKIFSYKKAKPDEVNERCLSCHSRDQEHAHASNSIHARNQVSCVDCHSPHKPAVEQALLAKSQPQLCYSCHLNVKPQFNMPFHHRVEEKLINCSDCHNPHGSAQKSQTRSTHTQDEICSKCHIDKQGPFVFEHQPVKTEGCTSCHVPHGSPNPRMLKLSQVNLLCLQCHTPSSFSGAPGTPSFHNQATQFQACTLCHTQIHGSNFSAVFFK